MTKVLVISNSLIPSVLLCGHAQLDYLKNKGLVEYKFLKSSKIRSQEINWADILVFVRSESYLEAYASKLAKGKKHMVYVLDDDILNLPDYISCAKYYKIPGIHNNIITIMNNCDTFLTPSRILLDKYGKSFKYADLIDEPSLNTIKEKKDNKRLKIGFAGSIDRTQDINNILTESLIEIIKKYKDVDVEFMGAKPSIVSDYKLKYIPYQDGYKKYTKIMGEANWDIGLAPMPISDFHKCKYFNKYVEYASFGIAGIYTNTEPYVYGINDGENGLLVNNSKDEWVNAISRLIEDNELRKRISKNSIKEANTIYSLETLSQQYLDRITKNYQTVEDESFIDISFEIRIKVFAAMLKDKIMIQRWRFPFWVIKYITIKILEKMHLWKKPEDNDDYLL